LGNASRFDTRHGRFFSPRRARHLPFLKEIMAAAAAMRQMGPSRGRGRRASWQFALAARGPMSPQSIEQLLAVALGFAVAGLVSTGYQLLTHRQPSFHLLGGGPRPATFAAVPFLAFAAPFIIMRNTLRGRRLARQRFEFAALATIAASFWSMMSGTLVVMMLQALERLLA